MTNTICFISDSQSSPKESPQSMECGGERVPPSWSHLGIWADGGSVLVAFQVIVGVISSLPTCKKQPARMEDDTRGVSGPGFNNKNREVLCLHYS